MPIGALKKVAESQNGLGAFILQCRRLDFHFCDWAGSSRGMNNFIKYNLPAFARVNPEVEIHVSPRPGKHPVVRAHYINGHQRAVCVRNQEKEQVLAQTEFLRDASGEKMKRTNKKVKSSNESVRGIWSPFHATGQSYPWRI